MTRLVHIHLGEKGGAERFFVHLVNALAEKNIEQIAFVRPDRVWRPEIERVCKVHEFHFRRGYIWQKSISWQMARIWKPFKPSGILAWMEAAARYVPENVPEDVITATRLGDYPSSTKRIRTSQHVICNTPDIAETCKKLGWDGGRTHVISNFTDTARAKPISRSMLDTPADAFLVVAMGRFVHRKGFDVLLDALARIDGAYLWLLGDGEEEARLKEQATRLGIENRVRMPGWVLNPSEYVAAADAFCCPSRHEPLGNVVLEGWGQGVPVVSTRNEGANWLIEDRKNGFLSPIDDVAALTANLMHVKTHPHMMGMICENAELALTKTYSRESIVDQYLRFFGDEGITK